MRCKMRTGVLVMLGLVMTGCPTCLTVATCSQDKDCGTGEHCAADGVCIQGVGAASSGGAATSMISATSSAGVTSAAVTSGAATSEPSSGHATSAPPRSSSQVGSSGGVSQGSGGTSRASSAVSLVSSSLALSSSGMLASSASGSGSSLATQSSSGALSSSSGGSASSACPLCAESWFGDLGSSGVLKKLWPAKASTLTPTAVAMVGESSTGRVFFIDQAGQLGPPQMLLDKHQAGPPALVPVSGSTNGAPTLLHAYSDDHAVWLTQPSLQPLQWTTTGTSYTDTYNHSWPVLSDPLSGMVVLGQHNDKGVSLFNMHATGPSLFFSRMDVVGGGGVAFLAAICSSAQRGRVFASSDNAQQLFETSSGTLTDGDALQVMGHPKEAPVILAKAGGARAFVFTGGPNATTRVHAFSSSNNGALAEEMSSPATYSVDISGAPCVTNVGDTRRLLIPGKAGRAVEISESAGVTNLVNIVIPHAGDLGGAVGVQLLQGDTEPTYFVGDTVGKVYMIRNGASVEEPGFGFPLTLDPTGIVENAPAVITLPNGRRGLIVTWHVDMVGHIQGWVIGDGTTDAANEWPEFRRDSGNTGCIQIP